MLVDPDFTIKQNLTRQSSKERRGNIWKSGIIDVLQRHLWTPPGIQNLSFQVVQSMVGGTGETEIANWSDFWKGLLGNVCKEQRRVLWWRTSLLSHHNSTTVNISVKYSSHLLGHFPLMMSPLHPKHSETHLAALHLDMRCLAQLGRLPASQPRRRHCHLLVWSGLLSQWRACQVRKSHKYWRVVKRGGLGEPQPGLSFMDLLPGDSTDSGRTRLLINLTSLCQKLAQM